MVQWAGRGLRALSCATGPLPMQPGSTGQPITFRAPSLCLLTTASWQARDKPRQAHVWSVAYCLSAFVLKQTAFIRAPQLGHFFPLTGADEPVIGGRQAVMAGVRAQGLSLPSSSKPHPTTWATGKGSDRRSTDPASPTSRARSGSACWLPSQDHCWVGSGRICLAPSGFGPGPSPPWSWGRSRRGQVQLALVLSVRKWDLTRPPWPSPGCWAMERRGLRLPE